MAKGFSEHERVMVRQGLIQACQECWSRYGYQKTGIRELTEMENISTGAFYQFFESKEMLFVATADEYQKTLIALFHETMRRQPDKSGVAASIKALASAMSGMPWLTSMWEEWPVIARKLPPGYVEQDFQGDIVRIGEIVAQYGLSPTRSIESVTAIIDILMASVVRQDFMPAGQQESIDFIIDAVVDNLFN